MKILVLDGIGSHGTYFWCDPATCQTIINSKTGQMVPEGALAAELGTTAMKL